MTAAPAYACNGEAVVAAVEGIVARHGLTCRGGLDFGDDEEVPHLASGVPVRSVLLIGSLGAGYWTHFARWREERATPVADPLDTWSRQVIAQAAEAVGADAASPSDRPYHPFQRWAMRAEGLRPSPLGVLMHPEAGLWHAYRGVLLFGRPLGLRPPSRNLHACDACAEKPCLRACPVGAYRGEGFAYGDCLGWLRGEEGADCLAYGCRDRNACPLGTAHRYPAEVQAFHMAAFARM